eukprot:COSAG01_NODE_2810_length_7035_cov_682.138985_1_plen_52_part_00
MAAVSGVQARAGDHAERRGDAGGSARLWLSKRAPGTTTRCVHSPTSRHCIE